MSGGSEALFSVSGYDSDGQSSIFYPELQATTPTGGVASGLDFDRSWSLFGHASRQGWTAQGLWAARTKGIPTGAFDTALNDDRSRTRDAHAYVDLSYEGGWRGSTISFRTSYDRYDYDGTYAAQMAQGLDPDPLSDDGHGAWWTTELSAHRRIAERHLFTVGGEFRENNKQDQGTGYPVSGEVLLDDRRSSKVWGLYVQDEYHVTPRILINAGLRYDRLQDATTSTNPRVALIFRPQSRASLKLLYGQAFRAPNVYELFYGAPDDPRHLDPERIRSSEVVWEQHVTRRFRVAASAFLYRIHGLITQLDSDSVFGVTFANVDEANASGLSTEGEMSLVHGLHALVNYTYTDAKDPSTHVTLSNSPAHVAHVRLIGPIASTGTFVGVEGTMLSERETVSASTAPGVVLWNVTLTNRRAIRHTELAFDVRNIFNHAHGDPGAAEHVQTVIPQVGRTVGMRAMWRF
jgi:iron complex outermembrane receptor protein